jgi:hypothetical protein
MMLKEKHSSGDNTAPSPWAQAGPLSSGGPPENCICLVTVLMCQIGASQLANTGRGLPP